MHTCPSCQAQALEYLYGLLDDAERRAMQDHLDGCAACRAELDKARRQQDLLAAAARMEFPEVRFTPPAEEESRPAVVLPLAAPARKRARPWRRWAAAAAILLALGGLAVPGWRLRQDYAGAEQVIGAKQAQASAADARVKAALARMQELPGEERRKIEEVRAAARARQLELAVVGPATAQSGAPTTYEIQTTNLDGKPVAADVSARVVDAEKKVVAEGIPVIKAAEGKQQITLPSDLPVTPANRLTLVVSAKREDGLLAQVNEQFDLAAPVYVTHLETDKPMYQPGEVVHYRSLTLDRFSFKPAEEDLRLSYGLVTPTGGTKALTQGAGGLRGADGVEPKGPDGKPLRGVGAGDFLLDPGLEGGEYALVCREDNNRFPEQRRKFLVNNYPRQQLDKQLDFGRSSYGPGDEVTARCRAVRPGGEPARDQPVEATVLIDDRKYGADGKETDQPIRARTDDQGAVVVRFKLPEAIERGAASLGVTFRGEPVETIARPLPLVLKKLDVEFYPEGGDLAADLPNRVYFQVRTPLGKPADLNGRLLEDGRPLPVAVETLHDDQEPGVNQGMGRFAFTPRSGHRYELRIDAPAGIAEPFALPKVKEDGVVLTVPDGVVAAGQPIKATVRGKEARNLLVGLYCRGRLLQSAELKKGETDAVLNPEAGVGGVCRVTVFEETSSGPGRRELKPVAERLVYRRPAESLAVSVRPDRAFYVPGDKATLHVETKDEKGAPAPSVVMLGVTDKSVLTLADEKTHRSMPTQFLLTSEVRRPEDLEYADFLLGPQAKAEQALDLLLGVQGWRRFAEQDPARFRELDEDKEEADRLLMGIGRSAARKADGDEDEIQKIQKDADASLAGLRDEYRRAGEEAGAALADPGYVAAVARRDAYDHALEQARAFGAPLAGAVLLLAALAFLALGVRHGLRSAAPWYAASAVSLALTAAAVLAYRPAAPPAASHAEDQLARARPPAPAANMPTAPTAAGDAKEEGMRDVPDRPAEAAAKTTAARPEADKAPPADLAKGAAMTPPLPAAPAAPPASAPAPALGAAKPANTASATAKTPAAAQGDDRNFGDNGVVALRDQIAGNAGRDLQRETRLEEQESVRKRDDAKKADAAVLDERLRQQERQKDLDAVGRDGARRGLKWRADVDEFNKQQQAGPGNMFAAGFASAPVMMVREYAHRREPGAAPGLRSDFAETLYWHPALVLPGGKADVSFDLSDAATTFQATAFAHTPDGRLGAGVQTFEARLPFTLQPATPVEVTASDTIGVPLTVANNTTERRDVELSVPTHTNLDLAAGRETEGLGVGANNAARAFYGFRPTAKEGEAVLEFAGKAGPFAADAVRAKFRIVPEGFPVAASHSDLLEGAASETVTLPDSWVNGTLKCRVEAYPSTLADLQQGLESLLREPGGCFEQTSASNYPNLLILDYLKEGDKAQPEVERRARDMLARGYQRLTAFECLNPAKSAREGYEWFGGTAPPHEALTAYGLLEFRDMARFQDVDPAMLRRTRDYLMSRRDGKGGFLRNPRAVDSFGRAPDDVTDAYIVWALTESGPDDDVTKELDSLAARAKGSKDPYFLSLVANGLVNRARAGEAVALLKTVAGEQKEDGRLDAATTSITGSGGRDLQIETTALAVLGWLKADPGAFNANLQKAVKWVGAQRGGYGGFGSTQSTILALKALIAYTKANKRTAEGGELRLLVAGKEAAKRTFRAGETEALTLELPDAEAVLHPGRNDVTVEVTGKNVFPYTLAWTYQTLKPLGADDCPVRLGAKLSRTELHEGDLVRLNVTLENVSGQGQGMATAVIGLPGGLAPPEDMKQLKQYCRQPEDGSRPLVSAFEVRGRELVLYWRDLAPGQKIEVPLDLVARVPGEYTGPASRGYLYYNADHKHWADPLHVTIAAKGE